jgi:hypothetical protein
MISANPIRGDVSELSSSHDTCYRTFELSQRPTRTNTDFLLYPQPSKLNTAVPPSRFEEPSILLAWRLLMHDKDKSHPCSDSVNCPTHLLGTNTSGLLSPPLLEAKAAKIPRGGILPLEWILDPKKGRSQVDRILAQLTLAEAKEPCPWLRDDIRIAWITTLWASQGKPQPHVAATYAVLGLHPDKVWSAILARREAVLGPESSGSRVGLTSPLAVNPHDAGDGVSLPDSVPSPKKPVQSVGLNEKEDAA